MAGLIGKEVVSLPGIAPWVRPLILDLGCCGPAALQIGAPGYGLPGFEGSAYDLLPEQANVLIIAGRCAPAWEPVLKNIRARLGRPGWIILFGDCASCGGIAATLPAGDLIPADVILPGCPPRPEELVAVLARLSMRRRL